jgi:alkanesulfonate monooxygenase SsuD/methylene tetrahydromethanopterin reductase-like flavin-dependent oxidoreductase (luciferase family)
MTDYGHPITFGVSLDPSIGELATTMRLATLADAAGLDYVAIQDHAYNAEFLDTWTLISYLAAETERITFVPDVLDLQLRPPTITAKAAASLSVLSGGRIVLGVGGGASADGIAAMGGPRRTGREMVSSRRKLSRSCAALCKAAGSNSEATSTPSRAMTPARSPRSPSRSGLARTARGCWR